MDNPLAPPLDPIDLRQPDDPDGKKWLAAIKDMVGTRRDPENALYNLIEWLEVHG